MSQSSGSLPGFDRFAFIAEALDAAGGFNPKVTFARDEDGLVKPVAVSGPCYLVPYPRESLTKYAARVAVAVYENHLRSACERFVGYIVRKPPVREGTEGPLAQRFLDDADWAGNALDVFWASFMVEARARGSMLLLIDMPEHVPDTLAEQERVRALPYLVAIKPEAVREYSLDPQGKFLRLAIGDSELIDGQQKAVLREWTETGWRVLDGDRVVREGVHRFGRCPVLAFTERNKFPCFGTFEQIARLSRRIYNAQSELDEILRAQTFSLLTYQVPPEAAATFDAAKVAAVIGTHNMLTHQGDAPAFIAPDSGPADTYMKRIAELEGAIRRIGLDIEDSAAQTLESGVAKQIRFQALNSELSKFATRMQDFERQVWDLFAKAVNTENRVSVNWATDYTLADTLGELDKLTAMQSTGFPDAVLIAKRKQIVQAEFSNYEAEELDELLDAVEEPAAETDPPGGGTGTGPNANPPDDDDGDPTPPGDSNP